MFALKGNPVRVTAHLREGLAGGVRLRHKEGYEVPLLTHPRAALEDVVHVADLRP